MDKTRTSRDFACALALVAVVIAVLVFGEPFDISPGAVRRDAADVAHGTPDVTALRAESTERQPEPIGSANEPGPWPETGCPASVIPHFVAFVADARRRYDQPDLADPDAFDRFLDEQVEVEPPSADSPAADGDIFSMLQALAGGVVTRGVHQQWFGRLVACSEQTGEHDALRDLLVATYTEEWTLAARPALAELWFSFFGEFDNCDPLIFEAVHASVAAVVGPDRRAFPSGNKCFLTRLTLAARCDDLSEVVFGDWLALIALEPDNATRTSMMMQLALGFPYTPAMGRFIIAAMGDPLLETGAIELLYAYAGRQLGPAELQSLLESDSALLAEILRGERSNFGSWAMYKLLAENGGDWGAIMLGDLVIDAALPTDRRAALIAFLADSNSSAIHWSFFQDLLGEPSADIVSAAVRAIGTRARNDDDAYAWLKTEVLYPSDGEALMRALDGLAMCGREDLGAFLRAQVLPTLAGEARVKAVSMYAAQPGADPAYLAQLTSAPLEDPRVRATAACNHLMVGKDVDASASLVMKSLLTVDDAEVRAGALAATELYLLYYKGDDASVALWNDQYKPAFWDVGTSLEGWDPKAFLSQFASSNAAEDAALMSWIMADSPFGQTAANNAWIYQLLSEMGAEIAQAQQESGQTAAK